MLRTLSLHLALLASCVLSKPFESVHSSVGQTWRPTSTPPNQHPIELHISLHSPERSQIEEHLLEISNPASPRWRQHLTADEVSRLLQPSEASVSAVTDWLASAGVVGSLSHHAVIVKTTVDQAERLLNTTYSVYRNSAGRKLLRTHEYHLPQELHGHIETVSPTIHFPSDTSRLSEMSSFARRSSTGTKAKREAVSNSSNSSLEVVCGPETNISAGPDCVKAIYSIDWTASNPNTSFAIFDVDSGDVNNTDFRTYLEGYGIDAANASIIEVRRPGWQITAQNGTSTECQWDVEVSSGLTWPVVPLLLRTDTNGWDGNFSTQINASAYAEGDDYFLQFLHEMAYNETVPPVVSMSAGGNEGLVSYAFAQQACSLIAASSARGVTWIASSGDTGPSDPTLPHNTTINPQWPASCPWVLSVGATANPYNETAATDATTNGFVGFIFTGGGFSNYFARPAYQNAVVPPYINDSVTPAFAAQSGFNASGRGYPDVAAIGANVPDVMGGEWGLMDGTSASAPIWAAVITLLNDYEASRGKPTLGFVNPWLYSLPPGKGLRDIVSCNGSLIYPSPGQTEPAPTRGYNGSVGWDACTGLGVPMFDVLRASLP